MGDSVYRETTCRNQSNRYSSPASLPRPGILSRQVQSPRLDRDPREHSSASLPSIEPSDFRCSEGTTTSREGSQLTHTGAQPTQIDVEELKIHMHYWEAKMSHPTCSAQLQDEYGRPKSKAFKIQVFTTCLPKSGPELQVSLWHDIAYPYRFPPIRPPTTEWCRSTFKAWKGVLKGAPLSLAESLKKRSHTYESKTTGEWQLSLRDQQVLALAINHIGDARVSVTVLEPPWSLFLRRCREWETSEACRAARQVQCKRQAAYRARKARRKIETSTPEAGTD